MDVSGIFQFNGLFCVGNDIKFQSFHMQTCCVMHVHTGKCVLKKRTVTKMNLPLRDDELFLIFLNKKRKKLTFWVHPILKRQQQEGFPGLIPELKLYRDGSPTYFRMTVGQLELLLADLGNVYLRV